MTAGWPGKALLTVRHDARAGDRIELVESFGRDAVREVLAFPYLRGHGGGAEHRRHSG